MNQHIQTLLNFIEQSEKLSADEKNNFSSAAKNVEKELDSKNRDLEFETSLEKVRAVALSMRKAEELTGICEVLYSELRSLGFSEMRNTMINIHNDEKGSFINYDYSDEIGKSITPLFYNTHPIIEKQIKQIRRASNAFSKTSFSGKELDEWKKFRKSKGEKDDPRLENIPALYYYFYSIGTGSIGISSFSSLNEEKLAMLKRFRNVFDFAYRRYLDVAEAEAQAHEAKIEASLERVRSVALSMKKPDDSMHVCEALHIELLNLNFTNIRNTQIVIYNDPKESFLNYEFSDYGVCGITEIFYNSGIKTKAFVKEMHEATDAFAVYALTGKELDEWKDYRITSGQLKDYKLDTTTELYYYWYSIGTGAIGISTFKPINEEKLEILKRFRNVFDLAYRRYIDIEQAEAQAREAQIELSLERVRARTMAMQHSDELKDAAALLFQQAKALGVPAYSCGYNIWKKNEKEFTSWMSTQDGSDFNGVSNIPLTEDANFIHYFESKQKGEQFFVLELRGERMQEHYQYLKTIPAFREWFDYAVKMGFDLPESQMHHLANFSHGNLLFITLDTCPEFHDVFKRFAAVFEQTYTRFLDLQKAEAQAREAQIELSLERVRARTMAMQKSDELQDAAILLFQQMNALGVQTGSCGFNIWNKDEKAATVWMSSSEGGLQAPFIMPHTESAIYKNVYSGMKNGETFLVKEVGGKALEKHFDYLLSLPGIGDVIKHLRETGYTFPETMVYHFAFFNNGYLSFHLYEPYPEAHDIFKRFAKVFEQTYTRFLDLQKAEAQAREAQIEAALERVRSRTMGMQKSEELKDLIQVVYEQFVHLNIKIEHTGFVMDYKARDDYEIWVADPLGVPSQVTIPYFDSVYYNRFNEAKEKGEDFFATNLAFEEKNIFYQKLFEYVPGLSEKAKEFYFSCPALAASTVLLENVCLYIENFSGIPYSDEENATLMRFGKVFQQTYTRFLDLQKAEAQAREAKIEASLERVRSRSLAMHKSDELVDASTVLFNELKSLNIETIRTGVGIVDELNETVEVWSSQLINQKQNNILGVVPFNIHPFFKGYFESWKRKESCFSYEMVGEEVKEYYNTMSSLLSYPEKKEFNSKESFYIFFFAEGSLNVVSRNKLSDDECSLMIRFARVFGLIYRRFLDLQQAEAQAREAQIELALERVRARTMAMLRSDELAETAYILFQQFKELGQAPEQITIGIINESEGVIELSLTMHGSKMEEVVKASLDEPIVIHKIYLAWREQKKTLVLDLNGKELQDYNNFRNSIRNGSVINTNMDDRRVIYVAYFSKGIISISTPEPRPPETIRLLERFAGVFDLTFTRFLDLKQAEAQLREAQVEVALERVRSRTMAMHKSDELAETAAILFKQLSDLGIAPNRLYIFIINDETGDFEAWITEEDGKEVSQQFKANIRQSPVFGKMYDGWKAQKKSITIDLQGKDLTDYIHLLSKEMHAPVTIGHSQNRRVQSIAYFSKGCIGIASPEPQADESINLLERFAGVFNLTYTRFNDLQLAEAQTHKALIETALERVRGRALAMQEPEELVEVAYVLRHEMGLLGVEEIETGTVFIFDEKTDRAELGFSTKDPFHPEKGIVTDNVTLDFKQTWAGREFIQFFKSEENQISVRMEGIHRREWIEYIYSLSPKVNNFFGENIQDKTYHLYKFSNGAVGAASPGDISEDSWDLLKRAASVFSLAYSRFKDLTKARFDLMLLKEEKKKSDALLLNILPAEIADELKKFGKSYARKHEQVTILFADIKGFSSIAENLSADELVTQLDECFRAFDNIVEKHGLEKIKTIGDAYVCACGLPKPVPDNASKTLMAALDMLDFIKGFGLTKKIQNLPAFEFRVGIHTGPVITGVVGLKKFTYDIWGDAVNMAARMEQHGEAGKINISGFTYQLVKDKFTCIHRGKIEAKNKGEVDMYFVEKAI